MQHSRRRRSHRLQGHSLTELVVVMGMLSFVVSTATQLVHQMFHMSAVVKRDMDLQRVCQRVAIRLREDARTATSAARQPPDPESETLVRFRRFAKEYVDYRVRRERLERTVIRDGHQVHHEEFSFGPGSSVELLNDDSAGSWRLRVCRLVLGHSTNNQATRDGQSDRQCVLDVSSTVGRYQRLGVTLPREGPP